MAGADDGGKVSADHSADHGADDGADDGAKVAAALAAWADGVSFLDRDAEAVTTLLVDGVAAWAAAQGWRVYRRAPSVLTLPPPYQHRHSCLDVACARPVGRPVVIEVDRSDRKRTVEKLAAEAAAGRIALWLRWGTGRFTPPPEPVRMVTVGVTARRGLVGQGRLFSRVPDSHRPAPAHTVGVADPGAAGGRGGQRQAELFGQAEDPAVSPSRAEDPAVSSAHVPQHQDPA